MFNICNKCVADKSLCSKCKDHPEIQKILISLPKLSFYTPYIPTCPRGYSDCVYDPAYIKYIDPEWYKELYGDLTPEEAIHIENGCWDRYQLDPNENYYCYDDEDK